MEIEKYTPYSLSIGAILGLTASGAVAIPEIQRPSIWKKTQARELLDPLCKGRPLDILSLRRIPTFASKDGKLLRVKKTRRFIDGQQCVTALMTAISGVHIALGNYKKDRIKIAFYSFQAFSEDQDALNDSKQRTESCTVIRSSKETIKRR